MTKARALLAGRLRAPTEHLGLSLGDRACLALAMEPIAVTITRDRACADIDPAILGGARAVLAR